MTPFAHFLLSPILSALLAATVIGGISYGFWRWAARYLIETVQISFPLKLFLFGVMNFPLLCIGLGDPPLLLFAVGIGLLSWIGGWFHRQSGGLAVNAFDATIMVLASCVSSVFFGAVIFAFFDFLIGGINAFQRQFDTTLFFVSLLFYPALFPMMVWAWQQSRARPGIEVPLGE